MMDKNNCADEHGRQRFEKLAPKATRCQKKNFKGHGFQGPLALYWIPCGRLDTLFYQLEKDNDWPVGPLLQVDTHHFSKLVEAYGIYSC